jgi:superfamily I DNA and RNA helicase
MEIIGLQSDSIPIQKLISFPESEDTEEEKQFDDFNALLKSDFQDSKILYDKLFPARDEVISSRTLDNLSAAFALLKFGIVLKSSKEIPENLLNQNMLEGQAITGQLLALDKQDFLESKSKKKKLEDDEKAQKRKFNKIVLWLDPRQSQIMDEEVQKHQYIIGPPGTGKTILIQLKVLEVYQNNPESKVLIMLPYEPLVEAYKKFFEESGLETTTSGNLIFVKFCKLR